VAAVAREDKSMRRRKLLLLTVSCISLALSAVLGNKAEALSFQDLDGTGMSFTSGDGTLTFGNFEVIGITPALSQDLGDYLVSSLESGWRLTAPIGVFAGFAGDFAFSYEVWANHGLMITGASIFFNGAASGLGAGASISEDFSLVGQDASLFVFASGDGTSVKTDAVSFPATPYIAPVLKDIQVSAINGSAASISITDQNFVVTPEPSAALLLASGFIVLGVYRRRCSAGTRG